MATINALIYNNGVYVTETFYGKFVSGAFIFDDPIDCVADNILLKEEMMIAVNISHSLWDVVIRVFYTNDNINDVKKIIVNKLHQIYLEKRREINQLETFCDNLVCYIGDTNHLG